MTTAILTIIVSVVGVLATWIIGKMLLKWLQLYQDKKNQVEAERIRRESQEMNQRDNESLDRLREIEDQVNENLESIRKPEETGNG